jgi:hypothetical protein
MAAVGPRHEPCHRLGDGQPGCGLTAASGGQGLQQRAADEAANARCHQNRRQAVNALERAGNAACRDEWRRQRNQQATDSKPSQGSRATHPSHVNTIRISSPVDHGGGSSECGAVKVKVSRSAILNSTTSTSTGRNETRRPNRASRAQGPVPETNPRPACKTRSHPGTPTRYQKDGGSHPRADSRERWSHLWPPSASSPSPVLRPAAGCRFWWEFPRPRRRFADVGQTALDARTIAWHLPVVSPGRPRDRGHLER